MPIEAVIFDKDNALMKTEPVYFRTYQKIISYHGRDGAQYTWQDHMNLSGRPTSERFSYLVERFGLKTPVEEFLFMYRETYYRIFEEQGIPLVEGTRELLETLRQAGIKLAVGTGATRQNAEFTLRKTDLYDFFGAIVTSDDVGRGKPDPETFVKAASILEVECAKCAVVGDGKNDVIGAKKAGMKAIFIRDPQSRVTFKQEGPDLRVRGISQLSLARLNRLFEM